MYKQVTMPNLDDSTLTYNNKSSWLGWCWGIVNKACGGAVMHASAWDAWCNEASHADYNMPEGCAVPIYWDGYWDGKRYGHAALAIRTGDRIKIWSSPYTHKPYFDVFEGELYATIAKVQSIYGMSAFLGWSETATTVRLVEWVEEALQSYQRKVGPTKVAYRTAPEASAQFMKQGSEYLDAGAVVDFKGWVHGECVDGNDIWFVGKHTGGYAWSGAFEGDCTGLEEMATSFSYPTRTVGSKKVFYRTGPGTNYPPMNAKDPYLDVNATATFKGYVIGEMANGTDIWFVGAHSGGYANAAGFTDSSTDGLEKL